MESVMKMYAKLLIALYTFVFLKFSTCTKIKRKMPILVNSAHSTHDRPCSNIIRIMGKEPGGEILTYQTTNQFSGRHLQFK